MARPLPPVAVPAGAPERGWNKLGLFHPDIDLPPEPILYLDLDVVLTGRMDVFFEVPGDFVISNDWLHGSPASATRRFFALSQAARAIFGRCSTQNRTECAPNIAMIRS